MSWLDDYYDVQNYLEAGAEVAGDELAKGVLEAFKNFSEVTFRLERENERLRNILGNVRRGLVAVKELLDPTFSLEADENIDDGVED